MLGETLTMDLHSVPEAISLLASELSERDDTSILDVLDNGVVIERFGVGYTINLSMVKRRVTACFYPLDEAIKPSEREFSSDYWLSIVKTIESRNDAGTDCSTIYMAGVLDGLLQTGTMNALQHAYWCKKLNI
jgi:hypothetical protein